MHCHIQFSIHMSFIFIINSFSQHNQWSSDTCGTFWSQHWFCSWSSLCWSLCWCGEDVEEWIYKHLDVMQIKTGWWWVYAMFAKQASTEKEWGLLEEMNILYYLYYFYYKEFYCIRINEFNKSLDAVYIYIYIFYSSEMCVYIYLYTHMCILCCRRQEEYLCNYVIFLWLSLWIIKIRWFTYDEDMFVSHHCVCVFFFFFLGVCFLRICSMLWNVNV